MGKPKIQDIRGMIMIEKMIRIADTAKNIYKNEPLSYICIGVVESHGKYYVEVEATPICNEHLECWEIIQIDKFEVDTAVKLIHRIKFNSENVIYNDNGIEFYVKDSPKLRAIESAINDLKDSSFYKELHHEDGCSYSCILKNTKNAIKDLERYVNTHSNVSCYFDEGIYHIYMR